MDLLTPELEEFLTANGYYNLVVIEGKICGLHDYITTRAIIVGLTMSSYERRYCYQNRFEAVGALKLFNNVEQSHPVGNWIKLKGVFQGRAVDMLNPLWSNS